MYETDLYLTNYRGVCTIQKTSSERIVDRCLEQLQGLVGKILCKKDPKISTFTSSFVKPISEAERESLGRLRHFVILERNHS